MTTEVSRRNSQNTDDLLAASKLFAAAPDLLAACQAARDDYENINHPTETHKAIMKQLDAAIKLESGELSTNS